MRIDLHAPCWNEEQLIPFFLAHYEPIADRMVIYDDGSTDRSCELLAASPKVELRELPRAESFIDAQLSLEKPIMQESRGQCDWTIMVDIDEFLYHRDLRGYLALAKENGITLVQTNGYDMISETFPPPRTDLCRALVRGSRQFYLDKICIFDPNQIDAMNYTPGRHLCAPTGNTVPGKRDVALLHYKQLGVDYLLARTREMLPRHSDADFSRGWGVHYARREEQIRREFNDALAASVEVIKPRPLRPPAPPPRRRWWRRWR